MIPGDWVGREIDGRYIVESVLGVGGMGTVLRAKHKFTGVPVAVKVLRSELQLDQEVQERFLAEAQAPNKIGHPAIVKVLDAGRMPEGTLYMAMELLVGRSLRVAVTRRDLTPDKILRIALDLLNVLGAAHAKGFVHRDLKPDNVFLCAPNDEVKLLDFGIAKVLDDAVRRARTVAGAILGTPAYMAPEQLADASNVDARADLWAVGVMLYEMVTGRLPLHGTNQGELLAAVASGRTTPIRAYVPHASRELEAFFERALAPDPRRRFGAAVEIAQALGGLALPIAHTKSPGAEVGYSATVGAVSTMASVARAPAMHTPMAPSAVGPQSTPMTPSAFAPPIGPQSTPVAPSAFAPLAIGPQSTPMAPSAFAPQPMVAARSNRTLLIAIGAAVVIGAAIVIAVAAGGSKTATIPDAAEVRAPDPPDRVVERRPPDPKPDDDNDDDIARRIAGSGNPTNARRAPAQSGADYCRSACGQLARKCGTHLPTCEQDCLRVPASRTCLEQSANHCATGALCGSQLLCPGRMPSGTSTCSQVVACQVRCGTNFTCGCNCLPALDPRYILQLAQINACAFRCNLDNACMERNCRAQADACK